MLSHCRRVAARNARTVYTLSADKLLRPSTGVVTQSNFGKSASEVIPSVVLGLNVSYQQTVAQASDFVESLIQNILLFAVPKSKVSHSKKRMRSASKGLKNLKNIQQCPSCGTQKLQHHVVEVPADHLENCPDCIFKRWLVFRKD
jgi:ribosomal protein L32